MNKLLSIEEHNSRILKPRLRENTGVSCPNCNSELLLKEPSVMLLSNPPQAEVVCSACEYQTRIYV